MYRVRHVALDILIVQAKFLPKQLKLMYSNTRVQIYHFMVEMEEI